MYIREHEWDKHGKYAIGTQGIGNIGEYFTKTIELARNYYDIYQYDYIN